LVKILHALLEKVFDILEKVVYTFALRLLAQGYTPSQLGKERIDVMDAKKFSAVCA